MQRIYKSYQKVSNGMVIFCTIDKSKKRKNSIIKYSNESMSFSSSIYLSNFPTDAAIYIVRLSDLLSLAFMDVVILVVRKKYNFLPCKSFCRILRPTLWVGMSEVPNRCIPKQLTNPCSWRIKQVIEWQHYLRAGIIMDKVGTTGI